MKGRHRATITRTSLMSFCFFSGDKSEDGAAARSNSSSILTQNCRPPFTVPWSFEIVRAVASSTLSMTKFATRTVHAEITIATMHVLLMNDTMLPDKFCPVVLVFPSASLIHSSPILLRLNIYISASGRNESIGLVTYLEIMASRNVEPLYGWPRTSTRACCGVHHGARVHCFVRRNCMAIPNLIPARPSSLQCLDGQHLKVFVQSLGMLIEVSQEDVTNLSVRCFLWDAGPKASKTKRFNYSCTPASPKRILNVRVVGKVLAAGGQYEICGVCIGLCDCRSRRRQQRHET